MLFGDVFMKQLAAIRLSDACEGFILGKAAGWERLLADKDGKLTEKGSDVKV
jgi:hypothetical protein